MDLESVDLVLRTTRSVRRKLDLARPVPPELIEMAKVSSGNWKCKGEAFERDGSKIAVTATNKAKAGDTVRIMETRPLSKLKRWRLVEVLQK